MFFAARGDANALRQGAKLVAKLNARDPKRLGALSRLTRGEGRGRVAEAARSIDDEDDEEAFLFWALMGDGRTQS